jgi:hypothetical protein
MNDARRIARELREAAARLKSAAVWKGSDLAVDAAKDSYVFELLCYFNVALAAKERFAVSLDGKLESRKGGKFVARWPKSPGHKGNFSYLRLKSEAGNEYQLCPGIEIEDKHGKSRAPDVNLLAGSAGSSPSYRDLLACWDAKYSENTAAPLADQAVADFIYTYQQLGKPELPAAWRSLVRGAPYERSGIFTNAQRSSERDEAFAENGLAETSGFPHSPRTRP